MWVWKITIKWVITKNFDSKLNHSRRYDQIWNEVDVDLANSGQNIPSWSILLETPQNNSEVARKDYKIIISEKRERKRRK